MGWFCSGTRALGKRLALLPGVRQLIHHAAETPGHLPQCGMQLGIETDFYQRSKNSLIVPLHQAGLEDPQAQPWNERGPKLCSLGVSVPRFCTNLRRAWWHLWHMLQLLKSESQISEVLFHPMLSAALAEWRRDWTKRTLEAEA